MELALGGVFFLLAASCAAVMGFAIQRGATCTVAAVDELLSQHKATRLLALLEASVWVTLGLLLAQQLHWLTKPPVAFQFSAWTLLGAALLGVGAFVNRACVFGAIARLGSGEWAYVATPLGFYAGCVSVAAIFAPPPARMVEMPSPVLAAAGWLVWPLLLVLALRMVLPPVLRRGGRVGRGQASQATQGRASQLWSPHAATVVIGITFVISLVAAGAWAYTDVLVELSHGMAHSVTARVLLALMLWVGALVGGWTTGRFRNTRIRAASLLRCFAGGVLMGWGSLLIPGGNDGLILVGMPLLWPYAWLAFATMCLTIACAQLLQGRVRLHFVAKQ